MFWRLPNFFCIDNGIGSLLEHLPLPKGQIFDIGERGIGSLLEMLCLYGHHCWKQTRNFIYSKLCPSELYSYVLLEHVHLPIWKSLIQPSTRHGVLNLSVHFTKVRGSLGDTHKVKALINILGLPHAPSILKYKSFLVFLNHAVLNIE